MRSFLLAEGVAGSWRTSAAFSPASQLLLQLPSAGLVPFLLKATPGMEKCSLWCFNPESSYL